METVADSIAIDGSRNFSFVREIEERITAMIKPEAEKLKEMMDQCIARRDNGKNMKVAKLGSEALKETASNELEDYAIFSDDDFSDDDSFFDSYDEIQFDFMDDDRSLQNIRERHSNSESLESTTKNEFTVGKPRSKGCIACEFITSCPCIP